MNNNSFIKSKKIFLIFLFLSILINFNAKTIQDVSQKNTHIIVLNDGREYNGKLIKIDETNVYFLINNEEKIFKKSEIDKIQFQKYRKYQDIKKIQDIKDGEIQSIWNQSKNIKPSKENQLNILLDKTTVEFLSKNKVKMNIKKAMKVLNESGKDYSTQYFYYLKNHSSANLLYAFTILPDGSISSIDESAVNDEPLNNEAPHYDLFHRIKFGLKDVDVSSVFVWEAEIIMDIDNIKIPFLLKKDLIGQFDTANKIIEIIYPKNLKINYQFYEGLIPFEKKEIKTMQLKDKLKLVLDIKNINGYINDENNTPDDDVIYPSFYLTLNNSWENLSNEYYEKYFNIKIKEATKEFAKNIVKNEKDDFKKLQLLYEYINRKIDLTDINMNEYYFTPTNEEEVIKLSTLNVFDKSYLFYLSAKSLDIPVKLYIVRNNYNNEMINKVVSVSLFDNVINSYNLNNENIYFSFENQNFNVNDTYFDLSNALALEVSAMNSKLIKLKEIKTDENNTKYSFYCKLQDNNSLHIKRITETNGSDETYWRAKRFLSKDELNKLMNSRITSLGNDVELNSYDFINKLNDFDKSVLLEENLILNNFLFSSGDKFKIFKLPGLNFSARSVSKKNRVLPFNFDKTEVNSYYFEIDIPQNYKVSYMPQNINIEENGFIFKTDFILKDNKLLININVVYSKNNVAVQDYLNFKTWVESKARFANEWILLEKTK